jgi:GTP-binding protein
MLKIKSVEFVTSVAKINQLPKNGYPEIAFAGRSNVGKSSLLNVIFSRKKMALTSSTPGKTRLLNFFDVNQKYHFVDLPGYGFAKVSKSQTQGWKKLIEAYLSTSQHLKGLVVLVDIRHSITNLDFDLFNWIRHYSIPLIVVGTKADKLSGNKLAVSYKKAKEDLKAFNAEIILFSAISGRGKPDLMRSLNVMLNGANK